MSSSDLEDVIALFNAQPHIDDIDKGLSENETYQSDKYTFMLKHKHFDLSSREVLFVERVSDGYNVTVKDKKDMSSDAKPCMWLFASPWMPFGYTRGGDGYDDVPELPPGDHNLGARWLNTGGLERTDELERVQHIRPEDVGEGAITTLVNWDRISGCASDCVTTTCHPKPNGHTWGHPRVHQGKKLPRDTRQEKRIALIHECVIAALNYLLVEDIFQATNQKKRKVKATASEFEIPFDPDVPSRLGDVTTVIRDVAVHSTRPMAATLDILLTAITGIPYVTNILQEDSTFGNPSSHINQGSMLTNVIVYTLTNNMTNAFLLTTAAPGGRWKYTLLSKTTYIHKLYLEHGHHMANDDVLYTFSKIDEAHAMLEHGVALKVAGKKICFVAPDILAMKVTHAVADTHMGEADLHDKFESKQPKYFLVPTDLDTMKASDLNPDYGQWTGQTRFSRATLADFISRDGFSIDRVAANSHGDVMFFVRAFGPWNLSRDVRIRSESTSDLLRETVHGYSDNVPVESRVDPEPRSVEDPARSNSFDDSGVLDGSFHPCTYKPTTLDAIINEPGRVLVNRRGIRGNLGRFLAAGILGLGIAAVALNFAKRDNWLEIAFDGAQVMSLVTGVVIAVLYVVNGTIASTLDWLGGKTEVKDEKQLAIILGVSVNEMKVACTYEKGNLFWLSEVNSCFCPAGRFGTIVFSELLDLKMISPHVVGSCIVGKDGGLWILQGWAFRIQKEGDVGHMVRVPYEDRVYVNDGDLREVGGGVGTPSRIALTAAVEDVETEGLDTTRI